VKALVIAVGFVIACSGKKSDNKPVSHGPRTQITYEIDLDIAIDDRAAEIRRDLEAGFADEKVAASVRTPATPRGALTIVRVDGPTRIAVQEHLKPKYADTLTPRQCPVTDGPDALCFEIAGVYAETVKKAALAAAVKTVRARFEALGMENADVFAKGEQIVVEIPTKDPDRLAEIRNVIARAGKLELKVVDNDATYMRKLYAHVGAERSGEATDPRAVTDEIRADIDQWRLDDGGLHTDYYLTAHDRDRVTGRAVIEKYLEDLRVADPSFVVPDDRQIGYERVEPQADAKDQRPYWRTYYLERGARLTGAAIANAEGTTDPNAGIPIVILDFNRAGTHAFAELTASIVGRKLATVLDGTIKSAPIINGAISGGRAAITMGGNDRRRQELERDELVDVLRTGSLPAPLREASVRELP
jgi:protein-export membrane protein SecD